MAAKINNKMYCPNINYCLLFSIQYIDALEQKMLHRFWLMIC